MSLGITPANCAAASISAIDASGLSAALRSSPEVIIEFSAATQAVSDARARLGSDLSTLSSDLREQETQSIAVALQRLASAKAALDHVVMTAIGAERAAALQRALLTVAAGLPAEYSAVELSNQDRQRLVIAIKAEHRQPAERSQVPSQGAELLNRMRADARVVAARSRIDLDSGAISSALAQ